MKKLLVAFMLVMLCAPAWAAFQGPAGQGPVATVRDALNATWDDAYMCLEGNIVEQVRHDKYTFRDATGSMVVEIKPKHFGAVNVTPANKVRICGEVDKEYLKNNEFEAKVLQVLQ